MVIVRRSTGDYIRPGIKSIPQAVGLAKMYIGLGEEISDLVLQCADGRTKQIDYLIREWKEKGKISWNRPYS